jgi:hypothetical protein
VAAGLALGAVLLWWRFGVLVLDGRVSGYHWPAWVFGAWNRQHGRAHMLDPFREPLHPALLGPLGELLGYADGALLLAGASAGLAMGGVALAGWALRGPWTGGAAAVALALAPVFGSGARWGTGYPLATGLMGLTLGLAAAAGARGLRWRWLVPLAGVAVLAQLADTRAVLVVPVAGLLLAWGLPRARGLRRWLALPLLVGAVVLGRGAGLREALGQERALGWAEKRAVQTRVVARWTRTAHSKSMERECGAVDQSVLLTPAFFTTPCAREVLADNLGRALPGATAWPVWVLALAGILMLRSHREAAVVLGLVATWGLAATATPLPARYQLLFTPLLALVVPLGLGGPGRREHPVVLGIAVLVVILADPHDHRIHPVRGIDARWTRPAELAAALPLEPGDRVFDCAGESVELALLPDHSDAMGPHLDADAAGCLQAIEAPAGGRRRVVLVRPDRPPRLGTDKLPLGDVLAGDDRWSLVETVGKVEVWALSGR